MEEIGVRDGLRPTVGQMMVRDMIVYMIVATDVMLSFLVFFLPSLWVSEGETDAVDPSFMYLWLVAVVGFGIAIIHWRWRIYSSVISSGAEVPGEITSITRSGDSVMVEYTYRWQAETIKSTHKVGGYIPKRRIKEEVGLKATLLVAPAKPTRFLVLDSVR